ncbi:MAG: IS200/IS605 family transposase [Ignavibacteriaceae bacterium]
MADAFTQVYVHVVFIVQNRYCVISESWKDELYKYIAGIIRNNKHKLLAINGVRDHIHLFIGMKPSQSLSDLMQDIKAYSSRWINDKNFVSGKFNWQSGYGAFSYSHSQVDTVIKYIMNQEQHHHKKTFKEEYIKILKDFEILYEERDLFKWID